MIPVEHHNSLTPVSGSFGWCSSVLEREGQRSLHQVHYRSHEPRNLWSERQSAQYLFGKRRGSSCYTCTRLS